MVTILCIEDECFVREIITEELEDAGYDVRLADNGKKGLGMIIKYKPDLVLCDINMPQKNGYELLKEIRDKHQMFAEMPFIFLTALSDEDQIITGLKSGADAYLTKPINFAKLLATIQSSLLQVARIKQKYETVLVLENSP